MRRKELINFPRLNDKKGDLTQTWYVEFSYTNPRTGEKIRNRIYDGLGSGTSDQRYILAQGYIQQLNEWLKNGDYLKTDANYKKVLQIETFRPENIEWHKAFYGARITKAMEDYKEYIRDSVRKTSFTTYCGVFNKFTKFVTDDLHDKTLSTISRVDVLPFFLELGKIHCRKTVNRYIGRIRAFFEWAIDFERVEPDFKNPISKIPNYGKIVDCAPALIEEDERAALKRVIKPRQPFLWLACELEYYCALRPGHEIRFLKVGDIDRKNKCITVTATYAKNKRTQQVDVAQCVLDLMEELNVFKYPKDCYVFTRYGIPGYTPLSEHYLCRRYSMFRDQLGISKDRTFYSWKHSGAVSAVDNGMDIYDLKDHLRHTTIATTEKYLRRRRPKRHVAEKYIDKI